MKNGWYRIKGMEADPSNHGNCGALIDGKWVLFFNDQVYNQGFAVEQLAQKNLTSAIRPYGATYYEWSQDQAQSDFGKYLKSAEFVAPITHDAKGTRIGVADTCKTKLKDGWWDVAGYRIAIKDGRVVCGRSLDIAIPEKFSEARFSDNPKKDEFWIPDAFTSSRRASFYEATEAEAKFLQPLDRIVMSELKNGWYRIPSELAPDSSATQNWYCEIVHGRVERVHNFTGVSPLVLPVDLRNATPSAGTTPEKFFSSDNLSWFKELPIDKLEMVGPILFDTEGKMLANLDSGWYRLGKQNPWMGLVINGCWEKFAFSDDKKYTNRATEKAAEFGRDIGWSADGFFGNRDWGGSRKMFEDMKDEDFTLLKPVYFDFDGKPVIDRPSIVETKEPAPVATQADTTKLGLKNGWYKIVGTGAYSGSTWHGLVIDGKWAGFTTYLPFKGVQSYLSSVGWWGPKGSDMRVWFEAIEEKAFEWVQEQTHDGTGQPVPEPAQQLQVKDGWYKMPQPYEHCEVAIIDNQMLFFLNGQKKSKDLTGWSPEKFGQQCYSMESVKWDIDLKKMLAKDLEFIESITHAPDGRALGDSDKPPEPKGLKLELPKLNVAKARAPGGLRGIGFWDKVVEESWGITDDGFRPVATNPCSEIKLGDEPVETPDPIAPAKPVESGAFWYALPAAGFLMAGLMAAGKAKAKKKAARVKPQVVENVHGN